MLLRMIGAGFACVLVASCANPAGPDTPLTGDPMADAVASARGFSGHVMVARGDDVVFDRVFGEAEPGRAMTTNELWRWASVTKQVVAVAVADAASEGTFELDTPVSAILPRAPAGITVRNLLQHTSGLADPFDLPSGQLAKIMASDADPADLCLSAVSGPPGERFNYNNCDFIVLGALLEAVDGGTWLESLEARVFGPAGMTGVYLDNPGQAETVAPPGGPDARGLSLTAYGASGALYGTPQALLDFDRALLEGRLLAPSARDALWDGDPSLGYVALGQWSFSASLEGCEGAVAIVERRGDIGGIQARNILLPGHDISVIVFTNTPSFDFGEIWTGSGFSHGLLSAAACKSAL
jgi:D-alanyl-D-alanine carboxypeptidase